jgi:hypothetical protein
VVAAYQFTCNCEAGLRCDRQAIDRSAIDPNAMA